MTSTSPGRRAGRADRRERVSRGLLTVLLLLIAATTLLPRRTAADEPPDPRWSLVYHVPNAPASLPTPPIPFSNVVTIGDAPPQNSPDVAVHDFANVTQSENSTCVDPNNPNIVFVSTNATDWPVTQVYGSGVYWSLDGGVTWSGDDHGPGGLANKGDPAVVIRGIDGRWVVNYISPGFGQGISYSDNQGTTWSHVNIFPGGTLDKNHLMVDNIPASPGYGNLYCAWSALGGGPNANDIEFVRSTNGGATWPASAVDLSRAVNSGSHDQGVNIQIGPNGEVYTTWAIYDSWPANETAFGFNSSLDGGVTWTGEHRAITGVLGHRITALPNTTIRHNSFPSMAVDVSNGPHRGAIYVVWTNQGVPGVNSGDPDIYIARSTDGGATFGTPVRVNQDVTTNSQWQPWVSCDPVSGAVAVIFYDRRDDPSNTMARAYMAVSKDGGATWTDFPVGDVSFNPTPVPGLAGGYMGDYLGMAVSHGKAYPTWSDNRSGHMLCYVSPLLLLDPDDPEAPTDARAFSDYLTPTSVQLDWTDPTARVDGMPLVDFSVDILRDGVPIANVDQGVGTHVDGGLTDGQAYVYTLQTRDDLTDSLSTVVSVSVYAGGSPTPAPPAIPGSSADTVSATIQWTNPVRQSDGTRLDDFAGARIYRNGGFLTQLNYASGDTGQARSFVDTPPAGAVYRYQVAAFDSETPVHESTRASAPDCFVGHTPNILVWQPASVTTATGDSIVTALTALGEVAVRVTNLFTFSTDLNVHEMVFACAGVYPNKHVLTAAEGLALDSFVQDGGRLYLEGGDCFNDDPVSGGYDVDPIFDIYNGYGGSGSLFELIGVNDLSSGSFAYGGPNLSIDELLPISSTPVLLNNQTGSVVGVFRMGYGLGRAIGLACEFGGLSAAGLDNGSSRTFDPAASTLDVMRGFVAFFRSNGDPSLKVTPAAIAETVPQTQAATVTFLVENPGTPNGNLVFTIAESPEVPWLDLDATDGELAANGSWAVGVTLAAGNLPPGPVTTSLIVAGNDPANPADTVAVTLTVEGIPALSLTPPALQVSVPLETTKLDSVVVRNIGYGPFDYNVTMIGTGGEEQESFSSTSGSLTGETSWVGNIYQVDNGLPITQIEHYLNTPEPTPIEFVVYEESPETGLWAKVYTRTQTSGTGVNWCSSGPIVAYLKPARTYFIGCGWEGTVTAYRDNGQNLPQNVAFGSLVASSVEYGYPLPDTTVLGGGGSVTWSQRLSFGIPFNISLGGATSGTLNDGERGAVRLSIQAENVSKIYYAALNVFHTAPYAPPALVPIVILTGNAVAGSPDPAPSPPARFRLFPPAPNPFQGATSLRFDLPRTEPIRLAVFDVRGALVQVLRDGIEEAGEHTVAWNGRGFGDRPMASGIYFARLSTATSLSVTRLILER